MSSGPMRVCFVCSGNICRSPMGAVVLDAMAEAAGLDGLVRTSSAGTGDWHIGERADARTLSVLQARGYDGGRHRAQLFEPGWLPDLDLVLAMDRGHQRTLRGWARDGEERDKVQLLRAFDPHQHDTATVERGGGDVGRALDVPDPYYSDVEAFEQVLDQVERACAGLLEHLQARLGSPPHPARPASGAHGAGPTP